MAGVRALVALKAEGGRVEVEGLGVMMEEVDRGLGVETVDGAALSAALSDPDGLDLTGILLAVGEVAVRETVVLLVDEVAAPLPGAAALDILDEVVEEVICSPTGGRTTVLVPASVEVEAACESSARLEVRASAFEDTALVIAVLGDGTEL
jgi:hypothetical protein